MESVTLSTPVCNFADTHLVTLVGLEKIIGALAVELARPQMLQMAKEIAGTLIGLGTQVWGDLKLYTVEDMREGRLKLGDAKAVCEVFE